MKAGVIGAGTMGSGIAQVFATNQKYQVLLCDVKIELALNGKQKIENNLDKLIKKGKITELEKESILSRIVLGLTEDVADCDLIVEAALEQIDLKKSLFKKLDLICKPETIFSTNTSSLSLTEINNGIKHSVIGMHFFNPAPVMKLVEVITGLGVSEDDASTIFSIAKDINKVPIQVKDSAGFVVNRLLIPMINEAIAIHSEGIASIEDIDTAMKLGANYPLGPLELGDLIGLDVCLAIMDVLYKETGNSKYSAHPLLRNMVRSGQLGRKTGKVFYDYNA